jgi:hypothetical protein
VKEEDKEDSVEKTETKREDHQEIEKKIKETNGNQSPSSVDSLKPVLLKTLLIFSDSQSQSRNPKS